MADLGDNTRFFNTESIIINGLETLGRWSEPQFLRSADESDMYAYQVNNTKEGRPDLIAEELYDAPELSWVLISFNQIRQPLNWPAAGQVIKYPSRSLVFSELFG